MRHASSTTPRYAQRHIAEHIPQRAAHLQAIPGCSRCVPLYCSVLLCTALYCTALRLNLTSLCIKACGRAAAAMGGLLASLPLGAQAVRHCVASPLHSASVTPQSAQRHTAEHLLRSVAHLQALRLLLREGYFVTQRGTLWNCVALYGAVWCSNTNAPQSHRVVHRGVAIAPESEVQNTRLPASRLDESLTHPAAYSWMLDCCTYEYNLSLELHMDKMD